MSYLSFVWLRVIFWGFPRRVVFNSFLLRAGGNPAYRTSALEAVCTYTPSVPHSSPEAPHARQRDRPLLAKGGSMGEKWPVKFCQTIRLPRNCWVLWHYAKLQHGTDGFTSLPKEGMLRNFMPEKSDGFGRGGTRELGKSCLKWGNITNTSTLTTAVILLRKNLIILPHTSIKHTHST
jgi:hypothetical protein